MQTRIKQYPPVSNLPAVKEISGLSKSSIYKLVKIGEFPAPKKLFSNRVAWSTAEVLAWVNSKMEAQQ
jgi:prophage regulatory protein